MARTSSIRTKMVAATMAGLISFAYSPGGGRGAHLIQVASAQRAAAPAKPAAAAPKVDAKIDAKKTYAAGLVKFKAADFAGALADFQVVDGLKPTPQSAHQIGMCQDNLQHYKEAVAAYERFLENVPPKMTEQGDEVKRRVAAIKALPGKVHVETTPAGASIYVDGKAHTAVTPADVELTPGKHSVKLSAENRVSQEKDIEVTFASKQDLRFELEDKSAAPTPPPMIAAVPAVEAAPASAAAPEPKATNSLVPALVTGGLAVVALGAGTVFGIMALGDKSDFDKKPTSATADDGENHALIADMAFGVALTLGVTSAVLFLSNGSSSASASVKTTPAKAAAKSSFTITPTPFVTAHGGGAGALVRF